MDKKYELANMFIGKKDKLQIFHRWITRNQYAHGVLKKIEALEDIYIVSRDLHCIQIIYCTAGIA